MQLEHEFVVAASFEDTWRFLLDPERVSPCLPGVVLDSVGGNVFAGRWKVKIGPITVTYRGTARLVETDPKTGTLVLEASGKESRGDGTAQAKARIRVNSDGASTRVGLVTDLDLTGRAGEFERRIVARAEERIFERFAQHAAQDIERLGSGSAEVSHAPPPSRSRRPGRGPGQDPAAPPALPQPARPPAASAPEPLPPVRQPARPAPGTVPVPTREVSREQARQPADRQPPTGAPGRPPAGTGALSPPADGTGQSRAGTGGTAERSATGASEQPSPGAEQPSPGPAGQRPADAPAAPAGGRIAESADALDLFGPPPSRRWIRTLVLGLIAAAAGVLWRVRGRRSGDG
jgi:carbon monoxide dehydrogenase subunit G